MRSDARKNDGKFSSNWEGSFRVREVAKWGAYPYNGSWKKLYQGRGMPHTLNFITAEKIKSRTLFSLYLGGFDEAFFSKY